MASSPWVWSNALNGYYYTRTGSDGRAYHVLQDGREFLADEPRILPSGSHPEAGYGGSGGGTQVGQGNIEAYDPATGVRSSSYIGPGGHRILTGTAGERERIDPRFRVRSRPREFFKFGKVFFTLWTEPAGSSDRSGSYISRVRFGQEVYSQIRRFVVVRESTSSCTVIPITTYGMRGLAKPGILAHEHALIYTGNEMPALRNTDTGIMNVAIRIDPATTEDRLDPLSRVNLGKVYTVEHNLKVKPFGMVLNQDDLRDALSRVGCMATYRAEPSAPRQVAGASQTQAENSSSGYTGRQSSNEVPSTTSDRTLLLAQRLELQRRALAAQLAAQQIDMDQYQNLQSQLNQQAAEALEQIRQADTDGNGN